MSAPTPGEPSAAATCEASRQVIARHAALAAGSVLIPIPLVDNLSVTAVQLEMLRTLARLHRRPENERELAAIIGSVSGGVLSALIGRTGPALALKAATLAIPVIGPLLRFGTGPAIMAGYTWVLGESFRRHYVAGGTTQEFTLARFREVARDLLPSGLLA